MHSSTGHGGSCFAQCNPRCALQHHSAVFGHDAMRVFGPQDSARRLPVASMTDEHASGSETRVIQYKESYKLHCFLDRLNLRYTSPRMH